MEEDIKILEELTKIEYDHVFGTKIYRPHSLSTEEVEAIENLIKGYRELKERNIYLVNERKKLEELLFMSNENYIEKSKVKEKIEELDTQIKEFTQNVKDSTGEEKIFWKRQRAELVGARNVLMELMED